MKSSEEVKEFYEKFSKTLIRDKIYPNQRHLKIKGLLKTIFHEKNIDSVLEIGCGIGILSEFIAKNVSKVVAIDISEENIKFAKVSVDRVNFHCGDFLEFPPNNKKFGLITLFDVLEHFPKEKHLLVFNKIKEFSTPETLVAITIPDADFLSYMRKHHPEKLQVVDESIYFDEFKKLIDQNNFEILKYEKYGIDYDNQYRFYLLGYKREKFSLEKTTLRENFILKIFRRIFKAKKIILGKFRYRKFLKD